MAAVVSGHYAYICSPNPNLNPSLCNEKTAFRQFFHLISYASVSGASGFSGAFSASGSGGSFVYSRTMRRFWIV